MSIGCCCLILLLNSSLPLLIFCPVVLSIAQSGMQKSPTTTVDLSISPFSSTSFCSLYFVCVCVCVCVRVCVCVCVLRWVFVAVRGLLIVVASLAVEHGLQGAWASVVAAGRLSSCGSQTLECRLSSRGARAQLLHGMWDLPGPGLKPMSPALAGRFLTSVPPGRPITSISLLRFSSSICFKRIHNFFLKRFYDGF